MADIIIILILLAIVGAAVFTIARSKKKGAGCIGCPSGGACCGKQGQESRCTCGREK